MLIKWRRRKGFTLMELLTVLFVLLIIVSLAKWTDNDQPLAEEVVAKQDAGSICSAVQTYKLRNNVYPPNLEALVPNYIPELPTDPWSNHPGIDGNGGTSSYAYAFTTDGFAVWSVGPNKRNDSGGSGHTLPVIKPDDVGFVSK